MHTAQFLSTVPPRWLAHLIRSTLAGAGRTRRNRLCVMRCRRALRTGAFAICAHRWGSSLFKYAGNTKAHAGHPNGVKVTTVDLTALVAATVLDRVMPEEGTTRHGQRHGTVIMKLDIEGGTPQPQTTTASPQTR